MRPSPEAGFLSFSANASRSESARARLTFLAALITASSQLAFAGAQFTDANWVSFSATNIAVSGQVMAFAKGPAGSVYVAGNINTAGGIAVSNIANWTGTNWSALGSGLPGFGNFSPYGNPQLAVSSGGDLFGVRAQGVPNSQADSVARWNGVTWSIASTNPVAGPSLSGPNILYSSCPEGPFGVTSDNSGNIYIGGNFLAVDGVPAQAMARLNGTNWSALGSGCEGVVAVLTSDPLGNIYAAGGFTYAGNVLASNIAKWDGTNWSALGSGIEVPYYDSIGFPQLIKAIAADGFGNVYAAGSFSYAGGRSVNHIAKWDGANWSDLGAGLAGTVSALALDSAGNLYAGGIFVIGGGVRATNIAKWDGTNWSALGSGIRYPGSVNALLYDGNGHLFVGGHFTTAGTNASPYLAEAIVGIATDPPTLTISNLASGGVGLSWPPDHTGWRLQSQRNPPGVGITSNWFTIPNSTNVNATNFPVNPGAGSVFYRLVYP